MLVYRKTFSIAMFCIAMALSFPVEIVIFAPARRASRKLLERMHEFLMLLDMGHRTVEYNQENLRMRTLEGPNSLIRSLPSKVSVLCQAETPSIHFVCDKQKRERYMQLNRDFVQ